MALRFETRQPKVRWGRVAVDLVVGPIIGGGVAGSYSGNANVMAVNDVGKFQVVEAVDPTLSVEDRMTEIQRDYDLLSTQAWREKYNVPVPFANG
jgi:hypothetical protein